MPPIVGRGRLKYNEIFPFPLKLTIFKVHCRIINSKKTLDNVQLQFHYTCKANKKVNKTSNIKIRRWGMIADETTLHERPNDIEIKNYRCQYVLQQ